MKNSIIVVRFIENRKLMFKVCIQVNYVVDVVDNIRRENVLYIINFVISVKV